MNIYFISIFSTVPSFSKNYFHFSTSPQVFLGDEEVCSDRKPHGWREPRTGQNLGLAQMSSYRIPAFISRKQKL